MRLDVPKLILDSVAVTTFVWTAPCHHASICHNRGKSTGCAKNLLNIPQLILDSGAVTTFAWIAPCHHVSICKNCSKRGLCATNLLNISSVSSCIRYWIENPGEPRVPGFSIQYRIQEETDEGPFERSDPSASYPQLILDSGAVTTFVWITPCHHSFICQNRGKSTSCAKNLLNIPQLILDSGAVTTFVWIAPCHHASICHNRGKSTGCAKNLLNIPQLILDSGAVTTFAWIAPCHHASICKNCSKRGLCATNLLNISSVSSCIRYWIENPGEPRVPGFSIQYRIQEETDEGPFERSDPSASYPQLILDSGAVTTFVWITPCHHSFICQNRGKSTSCAKNLLNIPQLILDSGAVTTFVWIAPCHHASICQNCSKRGLCATNLLNISSVSSCIRYWIENPGEPRVPGFSNNSRISWVHNIAKIGGPQ